MTIILTTYKRISKISINFWNKEFKRVIHKVDYHLIIELLLLITKMFRVFNNLLKNSEDQINSLFKAKVLFSYRIKVNLLIKNYFLELKVFKNCPFIEKYTHSLRNNKLSINIYRIIINPLKCILLNKIIIHNMLNKSEIL